MRHPLFIIVPLIITLFITSSVIPSVAHAAPFDFSATTHTAQEQISTFLTAQVSSLNSVFTTIGCTIYAMVGNDICADDTDQPEPFAHLQNTRNTAAPLLAQESDVKEQTREVGGLSSTGSGSSSSGEASGPAKARIVERIIERVTEVQPLIIQSTGITQDDLDILENELRTAITRVGNDNATVSSNFRTIAHTQKIDKLQDVTITNATIESGISGITDSDVPDTITASNYLPLTGGTLTGSLTGTDATFSGSLTVSGSQTFTGSAEFSSFSATSTATSSTISYRLGIGTTSPSTQLSVAGDGYFDGDITATNLTATGTPTFSGLGINMLTAINSSGALVATSTPTLSHLFATSTTATSTFAGGVNVGSGNFLVDFTSGNTTVGNLLTISGTGTSTIQDNLEVLGALQIGNSSLYLDNTSITNVTGDLTINTGSNNTLINPNGGNVGLGTTSPYATLSVVGETVSEYFTATSTTATSTIAGGFNVGSGGLTYDFSTTNVGIGTQAPSQKLSVFETTANPQFRISYDASNYADFTTSAAGALTITPSGDVITIPDDNLKVCAGGACQSDSTAGTGNLIVENDIETGGDYTRTCPTGYVWVPGSAKFGTNPGFCVMKYEAKDDGSGNAVSQAAGTPWVSISQENARAECQAIGPEYHLISEAEWMTIAEHIANLPINDMDADASIQLATGHTDNAPSNALASDASADPATSGCSLTADMEDAANAYDAGNCEIRGTGSGGSTADDKGFYGTGEQWSATGYSSGGANKAQLRTHVLPNGEVLWDIAGNVWEWTDRISVAAEHPEEIGSVASEWLEYTAGIDFKGLAYLRPPDDGWSSSNGIGRIYTDVGDTSTAVRAFSRGGYWNVGSIAGVFTLHLGSAPTRTDSSIGFRCAR